MTYLQLFSDGLDSLEQLTDEEAGQLIKAIVQYNKGENPSLIGALGALFTMFKNEIDRNKEAYETKRLKNKANGLLGGRPKTQNKRTVKNKSQKSQDKDKDKDKDIKNLQKGFIPPSLNQVKEYQLEKCNNVDAEYFYEYFTVSNWIDAKGNKVKNWKQKMISWNKASNNIKDNIPNVDQITEDNLKRNPLLGGYN